MIKKISLTSTRKVPELLVESLTLRYDPMGNSPRCGGSVVHIEFSVQLCPTLNNIKLITNIRIHADFSKYFEHVKCLDFLG